MLYDDREDPHNDGGLGFLLCYACGNDIIPKSGWPMYTRKTKFGWRKLGLADMRMYLKCEWKANLWRTTNFLANLAEDEAAKKRKKTAAKTALGGAPCKKKKKKNKKRTTADMAEMVTLLEASLEALVAQRRLHLVPVLEANLEGLVAQVKDLSKEVVDLKKNMQELKKSNRSSSEDLL